MTSQALHTALHANKPFSVRTADGKVVRIPHADHAALSKSGRLLLVTNDDDSYEALDVFLITAIEGLEPSTAEK